MLGLNYWLVPKVVITLTNYYNRLLTSYYFVSDAFLLRVTSPL